MLTVDPAGNPLTVKVSGTGMDVPLEGAMASEYVAVPPGVKVPDEPPIETRLALKLKSTTDSVNATLVTL